MEQTAIVADKIMHLWEPKNRQLQLHHYALFHIKSPRLVLLFSELVGPHTG